MLDNISIYEITGEKSQGIIPIYSQSHGCENAHKKSVKLCTYLNICVHNLLSTYTLLYTSLTSALIY